MAKVNEFNARGIQMSASGLAAYMNALNRITEIPKDTLLKMVDEKAAVIEEAEKESAKSMLQGPYNEHVLEKTPKRSKARMAKRYGPNSIIRFPGKQHGNRLGEIAFVNEYGKGAGGRRSGKTWRGVQPARPFIMKALEKSAEPATKAAAEVLFDWQKKKGL